MVVEEDIEDKAAQKYRIYIGEKAEDTFSRQHPDSSVEDSLAIISSFCEAIILFIIFAPLT